MMKTIVLKVMVGLMSAGLTAGGTADISSLSESVKFETIVAKAYEINLVQTSEVLKGDAKTAEVKQASGSEKQAVVEAKAAEKAAAEKAAAEQAAREQAERETTKISVAAQVEAEPVTLPADRIIVTASGSCSGSFSFGGEEQKAAAEQVTTDYGCAYCGYYAPDMDSLYKHFDDAHPQAEQSTEPQETVQVFGCSCGHHDSDYDAFMYHMAQHVLNGEAHNYNWWYEYPNGEICYDKVL